MKKLLPIVILLFLLLCACNQDHAPEPDIGTDSFASTVPIRIEYADDTVISAHHYDCGEEEYVTSLAITANEDVEDLTFSMLTWSESNSYTVEQDYKTVAQLDSGSVFLADIVFYGDLTTYGIRFRDKAGTMRYYCIYISGKDGSLICDEYTP